VTDEKSLLRAAVADDSAELRALVRLFAAEVAVA